MNLHRSYDTIFEDFNKRLAAVEKRVQGRGTPQSRTAFREGAVTPAEEIALLTAKLSRMQEEINRLRAAVHEKELSLETAALQVRRTADQALRHEHETVALRTLLSDEQRRSAEALRAIEQLKNDMRFMKAECDYRARQVDELREKCGGREEQIKLKEDEISRLFGRLKAVEEEREELHARISQARLRQMPWHGGSAAPQRRQRPLRRLFAWLSRPMIG